MDVKVIVVIIKLNVLEVCRFCGEMYDVFFFSVSDYCEINSSYKEFYRFCEFLIFLFCG